MNYDLSSFIHGQITSKIWLCEELEKHCKPEDSIYLLGGWHNVLGFMLSVRKPNYYKKIHNIDIDETAIIQADQICNTWVNELNTNSHIINTCEDCNEYNFHLDPNKDIVVSASTEHFENNNWFSKMPDNTMICIQTANVVPKNSNEDDVWKIKQPNPNLATFLNRFPMKEYLYVGTRKIQYPTLEYDRYMIIGRK
jgi:hypothetical protein